MTRAVRHALGLGANLGDRSATLASAVRSISRWGDLIAVSSLYETAPIGGPRQGPYLNAVCLLDTGAPASAVMQRCLDLEASVGRVRRERWGPRVLDLDILLAGDVMIDEPGLTVPHPRLAERRFVLEPLVEVWPVGRVPDGTVLGDLLAAVGDQEIACVSGPSWWR